MNPTNGKGSKRLQARTKLGHEDMQSNWDKAFGKKDKPSHIDFDTKKEFTFKGFSGSCVQDVAQDNEEFYHGKILDIKPHLYTYEADKKEDMYEQFCAAVNDYLDDNTK